MFDKRLMASTALAVASMVPQSGWAADAPAAAQSTGLEEIIVTARRQSENLQRTPVAVTAFTATELRNASIQNLTQIKDSTPNFNVVPLTHDPFNSNIQMRGQLTNNTLLTQDPSVGIYVDGVYQGPAIGVALNRLLDVERVEVLKGPQGTLYGRNTTGGAVNIYTKQPDYEFGGLMRGEVGRFGRRSVTAVLNVPLSRDQLALRVAGDITHTDGFGYDEVNDRDLGRLTTRYVRGALRMDFSREFSGTVRAEYQEGDSDGDVSKPFYLQSGSNANREIAAELFNLPFGTAPTAAQLVAAQSLFTQLAGGSPFVTQFSQPLSDTFRLAATSATFKYDFGSAALTSITAYRWFKERRDIDTDGTRFLINQARQRQGLGQFTQELQLAGSAFEDNIKFVTGVYFFHSSGYDQSISTSLPKLSSANPASTLGDVRSESYSAFGQATYKVTQNVSVTGGLRYTKDKKGLTSSVFNPVQGCTIYVPARVAGVSGPCLARFKTQASDVSYTAAVDWVISDNLFAYAKTSHGFKGGGLNLRITASPNSVLPFLPESVTDYEVGLKLDLFDRKLRTNLAYFYSDYKDIQRNITVANGQAPATITQNAASAKIDGAEVEITALPVDGLRLSATGAYLNPQYRKYLNNGVDVSAQNFQFFSKWTYSLSAAYTVPINPADLRLQLDWNWRSTVDFVPEGFLVLPDPLREQKSYGLLNGQVSMDFKDLDVRVAVFGRNLLDKRYHATENQLVSSGLGSANFIPGEPRTYGISITKEF